MPALPQALADLVASLPCTTTGPGDSGLATGIDGLDAALGGGLPRGRLTELTGPRGSGKATLLRRMVESSIARGEWVGYVDARRTLAPRDWAHLGTAEGLWMIRPPEPERSAWCADVLLRAGAFSLLVVDAAPPLSRAVAVRLTRLARSSGAALVVVGDDEGGEGSLLGGAVRLRVSRARPRDSGLPLSMRHRRRVDGARELSKHDPGRPPHQGVRKRPGDAGRGEFERGGSSAEVAVRRLSIAIEKGGTHRIVEVGCAIGVARRLCTHPQVPDRRGVARRTPWGHEVGGSTGGAAHPAPGRRGARPGAGAAGVG